jgi:hypothetical protein
MLTAIRAPHVPPDASIAPVRAALRAVTVVLVALLALVATARADTIGVKSAEVRADEEAYVLNAEFELSLNPTLEEALQKGVPLYFELELEIVRPRRYWFDDKILTYSTQYRVSYNALTRQYRVASGLFGQAFDGLPEVERFLSRVTSRTIARGDELTKGTRYEAAIRLRLDVNQLPKPFQLNALASREWSLQSDWHRWAFTP